MRQTAFIRTIGALLMMMSADRLARTAEEAQGAAGTARGPATIDVTVEEGTSMSVAVSPDGRTLAIDLQGSIWTLPATGGAATRELVAR